MLYYLYDMFVRFRADSSESFFYCTIIYKISSINA